MNTNVASFQAYKKLWNPQVIYVGDIVEWQDWDGQCYEARVEAITHKPLEGIDFSKSVDCLPLWEKDEYVVYFGESFSVIGDAIVRKVIKKAGEKAKALRGHSYAN